MADLNTNLTFELLSHLESTTGIAVNAVYVPHPQPMPKVPWADGYNHRDHLKIAVLISGIITLCVGVLGNSLVIYIIARFSEVRTKSVANYYIFNLALADIIFMLVLPILLYSSYTGGWAFGNPMCKIMFIMHGINKFASIFTLVALSLDRYVASYHTLGHLRTITVGKCVCVAVWVASIAMCTPYIIYAYSKLTRSGTDTCKIYWPQKHYIYLNRVWAYSRLAIGMIVPFFLIVISYILLIRRLHIIMRPRQSSQIRKPNRKMTKTVLVVVIMFAVCHLPYHVWEIVRLHQTEHKRRLHLAGVHPSKLMPTNTEYLLSIYITGLAEILVWISSCCNPILYGICNENYSKLTSYFIILYNVVIIDVVFLCGFLWTCILFQGKFDCF